MLSIIRALEAVDATHGKGATSHAARCLLDGVAYVIDAVDAFRAAPAGLHLEAVSAFSRGSDHAGVVLTRDQVKPASASTITSIKGPADLVALLDGLSELLARHDPEAMGAPARTTWSALAAVMDAADLYRFAPPGSLALEPVTAPKGAVTGRAVAGLAVGPAASAPTLTFVHRALLASTLQTFEHLSEAQGHLAAIVHALTPGLDGFEVGESDVLDLEEAASRLTVALWLLGSSLTETSAHLTGEAMHHSPVAHVRALERLHTFVSPSGRDQHDVAHLPDALTAFHRDR